jgi:hypothetical protein
MREPPPPPQRSRWPFAVVVFLECVGFAAWYRFLTLLIALGTCGADSDMTSADYDRACGHGGNGGALGEWLSWIAIVALGGTAALAVLAVRRRSWAYVAAAGAWLFALAVLAGNVWNIVGV